MVYDAPLANAVTSVREQLRIANKLKLVEMLERRASRATLDKAVAFEATAEELFRSVAHDMGIVLDA